MRLFFILFAVVFLKQRNKSKSFKKSDEDWARFWICHMLRWGNESFLQISAEELFLMLIKRLRVIKTGNRELFVNLEAFWTERVLVEANGQVWPL